MWRNSCKIERVCGRVFLLLFLMVPIAIWGRIFLGGKKDVFDNENRYATKLPEITAKNLWNGTFQDKLEDALADQAPKSELIRDKKIGLDNRVFKELSWISIRKGSNYRLIGNDMFQYKDYDYLLTSHLKPTWIDYEKKNTADSEKIRNELIASGEYYGNLPIRNKYIYYITTDRGVDFDHPEEKSVPDGLKYYSGFKYAELSIPDIETYTKYYYKNDHHWNYEGSYAGYKDIIRLTLGEDEPIKEPVEKVVFNYNAVGSKSKGAHLFGFKEKFTAYRFNFEDHDTIQDGSIKSEYGNQDKYFNDPTYRNGSGEITYGAFYGLDISVVQYDYHNESKPNLIMIGYSDTNAINNLVASHFNKTWVIDRRFCSLDKFEKIVSDNNIDYLLLIPRSNDFIRTLRVEPKGYDDAL